MDAASFLDGTPAPAAPTPAPTPSAGDFLDSPAPYQFGVLPFSQDAQGNTHFDPHAGLLGTILSAITAPGDAYNGKFDPMSPEGQSRARDLAAMISPMPAAARAEGMMIPGEAVSSTRAPAPTPTAEQLRTAASTGYDAARATGAEYPAQGVSDMAANAQTGLHNDGILPVLAPQTHAVLDSLQNPPPGATVTIGSLDAARKSLGRIGGNFTNPTEQEASRRVIQLIDQHIENAGAGAVPGSGIPGSAAPAADPGSALSPVTAPGQAGSANGAGIGGGATDPLTQAAQLIRDARGNSAAAFRSDRITDAEDAANLRAAASNSGQNIGNATRQRLASILNSDKQSRGFSPDELDAVRQVVQGTATSNTLRRVSNLLGGGGGLGQTAITGVGAGVGSMFGPGGAAIGASALPMLGSGARSAYNSLVGRQVNNVAGLLRQRSPLYAQGQGGLLVNPWDRLGGAAAVKGGLLGSDQQ